MSIADAVTRARAEWPSFPVTVEAAAAYFAERLDDDSATRAHAADLYLACACLLGATVALSTLERDALVATKRALLRAGAGEVLADDILSTLRERLLVGRADAAPLLASYDGRGPLGAWLRVCALRELAVHRRNAVREAGVTDALGREPVSIALDPELAYVKSLYQREFDAAFARALAQLTARQRNLLRHQAVHGLGSEQIGALYRVHGATAARWLELAREELATRVHAELGASLRIAETDLQSVLRLVRSQIDVGLRGPLGVHEE